MYKYTTVDMEISSTVHDVGTEAKNEQRKQTRLDY